MQGATDLPYRNYLCLRTYYLSPNLICSDQIVFLSFNQVQTAIKEYVQWIQIQSKQKKQNYHNIIDILTCKFMPKVIYYNEGGKIFIRTYCSSVCPPGHLFSDIIEDTLSHLQVILLSLSPPYASHCITVVPDQDPINVTMKYFYQSKKKN